MNKRNLQAGFTLIEIVMVLVLLGILASVAAPKYFDLQEQAKYRAAQGAVSEAQARINATFAQEILSGKSCNESFSSAVGLVKDGLVMGEWTVTASIAEGNVPVDATVKYSADPENVSFPAAIKHTLVGPLCAKSTAATNNQE